VCYQRFAMFTPAFCSSAKRSSGGYHQMTRSCWPSGSSRSRTTKAKSRSKGLAATRLVPTTSRSASRRFTSRWTGSGSTLWRTSEITWSIHTLRARESGRARLLMHHVGVPKFFDDGSRHSVLASGVFQFCITARSCGTDHRSVWSVIVSRAGPEPGWKAGPARYGGWAETGKLPLSQSRDVPPGQPVRWWRASPKVADPRSRARWRERLR